MNVTSPGLGLIPHSPTQETILGRVAQEIEGTALGAERVLDRATQLITDQALVAGYYGTGGPLTAR